MNDKNEKIKNEKHHGRLPWEQVEELILSGRLRRVNSVDKSSTEHKDNTKKQ